MLLSSPVRSSLRILRVNCIASAPGAENPSDSRVNEFMDRYIYLFIDSGIEFNTSITQIQGSQQQQHTCTNQRRNEKATNSTNIRPYIKTINIQ